MAHLYREALLSYLNTSVPDGFRLVHQNIIKNNGVEKEAVFVTGEEKEGASVLVYLEPYLDEIKKEEDVPGIARKIRELLFKTRPEEDVRNRLFRMISDYETARGHITFRLISKEKNASLACTRPCRPYMDLLIMYALMIDDPDIGQGQSVVTEEMLFKWQVTEEDLYTAARENTKRIMGVRCWPMESFLKDRKPGDKTYILTNRSGFYGASLMLFPECFADEPGLRGQDILIIPSSIHEVLLIPAGDVMDYQEINGIVKKVNTTIEPEEILSSHVYLYEEKTGYIKPVF